MLTEFTTAFSPPVHPRLTAVHVIIFIYFYSNYNYATLPRVYEFTVPFVNANVDRVRSIALQLRNIAIKNEEAERAGNFVRMELQKFVKGTQS